MHKQLHLFCLLFRILYPLHFWFVDSWAAFRKNCINLRKNTKMINWDGGCTNCLRNNLNWWECSRSAQKSNRIFSEGREARHISRRHKSKRCRHDHLPLIYTPHFWEAQLFRTWCKSVAQIELDRRECKSRRGDSIKMATVICGWQPKEYNCKNFRLYAITTFEWHTIWLKCRKTSRRFHSLCSQIELYTRNVAMKEEKI